MNKNKLLILTAIALFTSTLYVNAQEENNEGREEVSPPPSAIHHSHPYHPNHHSQP